MFEKTIKINKIPAHSSAAAHHLPTAAEGINSSGHLVRPTAAMPLLAVDRGLTKYVVCS
jgi:hypothetical protein